MTRDGVVLPHPGRKCLVLLMLKPSTTHRTSRFGFVCGLWIRIEIGLGLRLGFARVRVTRPWVLRHNGGLVHRASGQIPHDSVEPGSNCRKITVSVRVQVKGWHRDRVRMEPILG